MNSNNLLYIFSIDSFFNGLLFLLIYNIKLSKKDKIEYYNNFLLSISVRYLYFFLLYFFSIFVKLTLFTTFDFSFLACPVFIYLFYKKSIFNRFVDIIYKKTNGIIQDWISLSIYHIIQFLCKTVLIEESNIKNHEISLFYNKMGSAKFLEFIYSFILACVLEYLSNQYAYLGFFFQFNRSIFNDNYEKKQHILGLLNSKNWDQLFNSSTINLFFDIYKNSNNKQISKYINYQINRLQYKILVFFSVWSIVGFIDSRYIISILFYYIYIDDWYEHRYLYIILSFISFINHEYFFSILLFIFPRNFYYKILGWIKSFEIHLDYVLMNLSFIICCYYGFAIYSIIYALILQIRYYKSFIIYGLLGFISGYNLLHMANIFFILNIYHIYIINKNDINS
jgi:hypothetical protein